MPIALIWMIWHPLHPHWSWLLAGFVSGMLHVAYGNLLQAGYAAGDMNLVYPLARGTGPLVTVLVAVLVLGDPTSALALVGVGLIVAGVLVISFGRRNPASPHRRRVGIAYGVATGVSIAAYTLWDAHSVTALAIPALPYFTLGLVWQSIGLSPGRAGPTAIDGPGRLRPVPARDPGRRRFVPSGVHLRAPGAHPGAGLGRRAGPRVEHRDRCAAVLAGPARAASGPAADRVGRRARRRGRPGAELTLD